MDELFHTLLAMESPNLTRLKTNPRRDARVALPQGEKPVLLQMTTVDERLPSLFPEKTSIRSNRSLSSRRIQIDKNMPARINQITVAQSRVTHATFAGVNRRAVVRAEIFQRDHRARGADGKMTAAKRIVAGQTQAGLTGFPPDHQLPFDRNVSYGPASITPG